jgi:hypothetical protein
MQDEPSQAALSAAPSNRDAVRLQSTIVCPRCSVRQELTMPTDACVFFHECAGCGSLLRPKAGDCCVFCSYGDVPCPPMQNGDASCCRIAPVPPTTSAEP